MGTVNVYIPIRADNGERSTGIVAKGARKRASFTRSTDVRTFIDALADRNLENAIPAPKAKAFDPRVAPKGWRLAAIPRVAPVVVAERPEPTVQPTARCRRSDEHGAHALARGWCAGNRDIVVEVRAEHCGKIFRTPAGYAWHLTNVHRAVA